MKTDVAHTNGQHLQENSERASTKRGTILKCEVSSLFFIFGQKWELIKALKVLIRVTFKVRFRVWGWVSSIVFEYFNKFHFLDISTIILCLPRVWVYWCFTSHATRFQSYMWRHKCAGGLKKLKLYLRSGSQRNRHFAGFFNVPVLHRHGTNLVIRWFRHTAPLVAFYDMLGIRRTYYRLKPPAPSQGSVYLGSGELKSKIII